MSKLSELQGKAKTYKIGGIDFDLKPLTVDELELFSMNQDSSPEKQMEQSKKMIIKVLKNSVPDATDEEIKNVSVEHLNELMMAIMDLHKLTQGDGRLQKIKDNIQTRKDAIAARQA